MVSTLSKRLISHAEILADLNSVFVPHTAQIEIGHALFHQGKKRVFVQCGRKFGKMLDIEIDILTPNGFVKLKDIKTGDFIYDEQGEVTKVLKAHEVDFNPDSYEIEFCNGRKIKACADHLWHTLTKLDRKSIRRFNSNRNGSARTTKEIFETQMQGKEYNHSIPYAKKINMAYNRLPIDPYLLGIWLGDGAAKDGVITTVDNEIIDSFKEQYIVTAKTHKEFYIKGLGVELRNSGLLGNKHIPDDYLYGSHVQRLELLKGLMDSDGTINKQGNHCCFDNTNKDLAEGVSFLVASLGMKPILKGRVGKLNGVEHKYCYRVWFKPLINVFNLPRKSERIKESVNKKSYHHTIKKVVKVDPVPMRCLTVDSPSNLFLVTRDLIPTHNTTLSVYFLYRTAMLGYYNGEAEKAEDGHIKETPGCYYIAPFGNQARELIWADNRLKHFFPPRLINKYQITFKEQEMRVVFGFNGGVFIKVDGADNIEARRGVNPIGAAMDETKDIKKGFWDGFEPNLASNEAPILISGTPPDNHDNIYAALAKECRENADGDSAFFHFSSYANPHISREFLDKVKKRLIKRGEIDVWEREYLANIVMGGSSAIFPMLNKTHVRPYDEMLKEIRQAPKHWDYYISFDPGTVVCFASLIICINRYTKAIYVMDEVYETDSSKTTTDQVYPVTLTKAKAINLFDDAWIKYYDYAAAWFAADVANKFDGGVIPCQKDLKKKDAKLSLIKDVLLGGYITLSDRVKKLYWEMENYRKDDKGNLPKKDDHLIDNLRYILNGAAYFTIEEIKNEKVTERRGYALGSEREEELNELETFLGGDLDDYYD